LHSEWPKNGGQTATRLAAPRTAVTASATLYSELRCGPWGTSATPAAAR